MTTFHVRHDFSPGMAREALLLLRMAPAANEQHFLAQARFHDFDLGRRQSPAKIFASLRDLGLLDRPARDAPLTLTPLGDRLATLALHDELLLAELIHLRYSWLWTPERGGEGFAWAYQTVAGILWDEAPMPIDNDWLVATVIAGAEETFGVKGASFSPSSVLGIMHWLRALSPPCIVAGVFRQRPSCTPETLLLTLEAIATVSGCPAGTALRLDAPTRRRACRTLLIDSDAFDEVLIQLEEIGRLLRRASGGGETVLLLDSPLPGLVPQRSPR
ncbi:MAG: hypothetical protein MI924_03340 [Chloroflexales bacterium]|nr:hypothetical protein [Chloroflexales bacterium]